MGRGAGDIALLTSMACGAVACVNPEKEFDEEACMQKIIAMRQDGQRSFFVIVAEGVENFSEGLAKRIQERTGVETKFARLAHVVRGGDPTLRDRVAAARMGDAAVNELFKGNSNLVVCEQKGEIVTVNIQYALALDKMYKGKLKDGDLDSFTKEQIAEMEAFCAEKRAYFDEMYRIVNDITK